MQLELTPHGAEPVDAGKLCCFVVRFRALARTYARLLPPAPRRPTTLMGDPVHIANRVLHRLRVWRARGDYVTHRLEQLRAQRDELLLLQECLAAMERVGIDVNGMFRQTPFLAKYLLVCAADEFLPAAIEAGAEVVVQGPRHRFV